MDVFIKIVIGIISLTLVIAAVQREALSVWWARRKNRRMNEIPPKIAEQHELNCKYVSSIVHGDTVHHISTKAKKESMRHFMKWQDKEYLLCKKLPSRIKKLARRLGSKKEAHNFCFRFTDISPYLQEEKSEGLELFYRNGFTNPFHPSPDYVDYKIDEAMVHFFVLRGITPEQSKHFVFHQKHYYVNHDLAKGIIQFDVYKKPAA